MQTEMAFFSHTEVPCKQSCNIDIFTPTLVFCYFNADHSKAMVLVLYILGGCCSG